jgi:hypothetical protein
MIRLTFATTATLALLLLCASPSGIDAQSDTPVTIKDGGSIILHPDGLDSGVWTLNSAEIRHTNAKGVLKSLQVLDGGSNRCAGTLTCGVDATKAWRIQIAYGAGRITVASLAREKGIHFTQRNLPFDKFTANGNKDEREFGHGDGKKITSVSINGGTTLCSGKGCEIDLVFTPK